MPSAKTWKIVDAFLIGLMLLGMLYLIFGCATPHAPTRILSKSPPSQSGIATAGGYVYDELLLLPGIDLDQGGQIAAVTPSWAKAALSRVLDLQQALDECQTEKRALMSP